MYLKTITKLWVMFVCFKRRHYNKSPLVWLSNYLYWTKNCPQLASLMEQFITSFDEYPVEHTHSVVRRVTNLTNELSVVIRKIKNVFANKQSQANFRETFGHVKNYTFGKNKLKKMKLKAAQYLLKLFRHIANKKTQPAKKVSAGKTTWILPTILPGSEADERVLTLAFHADCPPNPSHVCDHQQCPHTNDKSKAWYVCEGCSHSYHNSCLQEGMPCVICQTFIKEKSKELAQKAKDTILQEENDSRQHDDDGITDGDDNDDGDDADELALSFSATLSEDHFTQEIAKLNEEAKRLKPPSLTPITTQTTTTSAVRKGPHCKECQHSTKDHLKQGDTKICQQCPDNKCSRTGRAIPCSCDWHTAESEINSTQISASPPATNATGPQQFTVTSQPTTNAPQASQPIQSVQPPATQIARVTQHQPTEFLLPSTYSQSTIGGRNGSNACTVISALLVKMHLEGSLPARRRFGQLHLSPVFVYIFMQAITKGNQIYDSLSTKLNINLYVQEVVNNLQNLKLKSTHEQSHPTLQSLQCMLEGKASQKVKSACIIVLPPDKSLSLLFETSGDIWIVDSHSHNVQSAMVVYYPYSIITSLSRYLDAACNKYWKSTAVGADTTVLELASQ